MSNGLQHMYGTVGYLLRIAGTLKFCTFHGILYGSLVTIRGQKLHLEVLRQEIPARKA